MKKAIQIIVMLMLIMVPIGSANSAMEIKKGDKVTIITQGTMARLCPYPNAMQNKHITRIPKGTILEVEGIADVKAGILSVKWFEVIYNEKRGWISMYDTDNQ